MYPSIQDQEKWGEMGESEGQLGERGEIGEFEAMGWRRRLVKMGLLLSTAGNLVRNLLVQPVPGVGAWRGYGPGCLKHQ